MLFSFKHPCGCELAFRQDGKDVRFDARYTCSTHKHSPLFSLLHQNPDITSYTLSCGCAYLRDKSVFTCAKHKSSPLPDYAKPVPASKLMAKVTHVMCPHCDKEIPNDRGSVVTHVCDLGASKASHEPTAGQKAACGHDKIDGCYACAKEITHKLAAALVEYTARQAAGTKHSHALESLPEYAQATKALDAYTAWVSGKPVPTAEIARPKQDSSELHGQQSAFVHFVYQELSSFSKEKRLSLNLETMMEQAERLIKKEQELEAKAASSNHRPIVEQAQANEEYHKARVANYHEWTHKPLTATFLDWLAYLDKELKELGVSEYKRTDIMKFVSSRELTQRVAFTPNEAIQMQVMVSLELERNLAVRRVLVMKPPSERDEVWKKRVNETDANISELTSLRAKIKQL